MRSQKSALATKNIDIENKIIGDANCFHIIKIAFIAFIEPHSPDYAKNEFVYLAASNEFEHYQKLLLKAIKSASSTKKSRRVKCLYHGLASNYNLKSFHLRTILHSDRTSMLPTLFSLRPFARYCAPLSPI